MMPQDCNPVDRSAASKPIYAPRKWSRPPSPKEQQRSKNRGQGHLFETTTEPESRASANAAAVGRGAAPGSEPRTAAAAGSDGPLIYSFGHCCDKNVAADEPGKEKPVRSPVDLGQVVGLQYRIRPCRCRRWFCEYCGPRQGYRLRTRLAYRLKSFSGIFGVTSTIDGKLFDSQLAAWVYVMKERLLSRFVRELDRRGLLCSKAYFWVVEFQNEKTLQPHWHLLLDAKRIDHGQLVEIWSRFRPPHAPPLDEPITAENYRGKAPAFGGVWYTEPTDPARASYYATKYLTKYPAEGYPDWVVDRIGRMPRYGHSHRFFPRETNHDPMCFCDECKGEAPITPRPKAVRKAKLENSGQNETPESPTPEKAPGFTIRQRLERCGQACMIVQVPLVQLPNGLIVEGKAKYDAKLPISFREARAFCEVSADDCWQIELDGPMATALEAYAASRDQLGEAT